MTTLATGCGEESKPWILKAKEGQRINITFIDFNWKHTLYSDSTVRCPIQYGYILDITTNNIVNLCGGLVRERSLHLSEGSSLQVLINRDILNDVRFLIGYEGKQNNLYNFFSIFFFGIICKAYNEAIFFVLIT